MIQNPKKTITVEKNIESVKNVVKNLHKIYTSINEVVEENELINEYYYHIKEGMYSMGSKVVFNLKKIDESSTEISIEIMREVGSYDQDYEVSRANDQMKAITTALNTFLNLTESEVLNYDTSKGQITTHASTADTIGYTICVILMFLGLLFIL